MTLTGEQIAFLARFSKTPEAKFLLSMYEAELHELDVKLRTARGEDIYRAQGRASQLDEMVKCIKNAEAKANPKRLTPLVSRSFGDT